ncbi:MAG: DUF4270 domain-containing protein, partial [Chlorobi bacterium]|nr:DUF4270 domain-containing protein [Chlorobiota bacterium]
TQNPDLYEGELIGSAVYTPDKADSTLRIPLNTSFGYSFIFADDSYFESTESFHDFLKGIMLRSYTENDDGAIVSFDITNDFKITLYFHDEAGTSSDFTVTANSSYNVRFNMISHDYSSANFAGEIDDDTQPQDSVSYIQAGGGLISRIKIPYIKNLLENKKVAVNRAELIIKTVPENISFEYEYPAIEGLFATNYVNNDTSYLIPDYTSSVSYLGESYEDGLYRFDITKYIQDVISGNTESNGINIYSVNESINVGRSIITTGKNSDPAKLIITYTEL